MSAQREVIARARVRVTVTVDIGSCWGHDCPLSQVWKQGADKALNVISQELTKHHMPHSFDSPEVTAILVTEKGV